MVRYRGYRFLEGACVTIVKWVVIDTHHRARGTYRMDTHEADLDTDETDPLALGQMIHDAEFGPENKRYFVKVLGGEAD
jgi:hypothetical protein